MSSTATTCSTPRGRTCCAEIGAVVALNRAVAVAMAHGPAAGLRLIDELADELDGYHLFHSARADLLRRDRRGRRAQPRGRRGDGARARCRTAADRRARG